MTRRGGAVLVLVVLVGAAFWPVTEGGFVWDDRGYVLENAALQDGFSAASLRQYFLGSHEANWHPLTWLSHALDCRLFGLRAAGHHAVNLALHLAGAALLLLVLSSATGAFWPSAAAAALFAVHPLRVESVAWIAQRKDVLAALFWVLALGAHLRHARRPGRARLLAVLVPAGLGLMSKPTVATLPAALLILDWWPLGRWRRTAAPPVWSARDLVLEKLPLVALSLAAGLATLLAQSAGGAVRSAETYPVALRLGNAAVSLARYLGQTLWPAGLSVFYPFPRSLPAWQIGAAGVLLAAVLIVAWRLRLRHPALLAGGLWAGATILPMAGIVQVGDQAMADRYTHLPHVGLAVALVWGTAAVVGGWRRGTVATGALAGAALGLLAAASHRQAGFWRDEFTLFTHAVRVAPDNALALFALGSHLEGQGLANEAERRYRQALAGRPDYVAARHNLAGLLRRRGALAEAEAHLREALRHEPASARAHYGLGVLRADRSRWEEALAHYADALRLRPDYAEALNNSGVALTRLQRFRAAEGYFRAALRARPDHVIAAYNLGSLLAARGSAGEARAWLAVALAADPGLRPARELLAGLDAAAPGATGSAPRPRPTLPSDARAPAPAD